MIPSHIKDRLNCVQYHPANNLFNFLHKTLLPPKMYSFMGLLSVSLQQNRSCPKAETQSILFPAVFPELGTVSGKCFK